MYLALKLLTECNNNAEIQCAEGKNILFGAWFLYKKYQKNIKYKKIKKLEKFLKKLLTNVLFHCILTKSVGNTTERGVLAQLGEHLPYKQRVIGSSPIGPICAGVAELADAQDLKSCG